MSYPQSTTAIIHGLMGISPQSYLFPFYDEQWLTYGPKDTTVCSLKSWADLWQHAEVVTLIADLIIIVIILFLFTFLENLLRFIRTERNCTENTRFTFEAFINESADDKVEMFYSWLSSSSEKSFFIIRRRCIQQAAFAWWKLEGL
jgi:hypothetical protein